MRSAVLGFAAALAVGLVVVLLASGFFASWDGRVAAMQRPEGEDPARIGVVLVSADGSRVLDWPADLVRSLHLGADPFTDQPGPRSVKERFSLSFTVEGVDGPVSTASPFAVEVGLLAALVALGLRNAVVCGAPWLLFPRARAPLVPLPKAGAPAPTVHRSAKGPPPPRPHVGRGRR